jgi:superfamily II DNA or RNA helicase
VTPTIEVDWAEPLEVDFGEPVFKLRGHQPQWLENIDADLKTYCRVLAVAPGGVGKTTLFAALGHRFHTRGLKTLVLANRERLAGQTAKRIRAETGLEVDLEMAEHHASPFAPIVVASIQTLGRINRLTGFSDSHFGLVVPDEAHFSTSPTWQRVMNYFHYGAESLQDEWMRPPDGTYTPKCRIAGFTATPDIGERKSLAEYYQPVERDGQRQWSVNYSYLEAVRDGWLVKPIQKCIPVKIDMRKYRAGGTSHGTDFKDADVSAALIPVIEELADQIVQHASDRKTMAFLPSVECARMMTDALGRRGLNAIFVSGECDDADAKADAFSAAGPGTVLSNAQIYGFGVDFPDVNCIAWFRATLSKAFYVQGIYRGTRVLPGIIDGLETAEERRAAIAVSPKNSVLILDPLFVSDRIDLCDSYDLFTDDAQVKKKMKSLGPPSEETAQEAERDFVKALNKAAKKAERKAARVINPLAWAMSLGDAALKDYVPQSGWESAPPTTGQIEFIRRQGMATDGITSKGLASKIIGRLMTRIKLQLATPSQLDFLRKLGYDDQQCATLTMREASDLLDGDKRLNHRTVGGE